MPFAGLCRDVTILLLLGLEVLTSWIEEKLLGVQIDSKLSFDNHVSKLWQKNSNKLYALARIQ